MSNSPHSEINTKSKELPVLVRDLGFQPYLPIWDKMKSFTDERDEHYADEIWVLEHQAVFTQGQAGKEEHLLATGDIPVVPVDRGGQVTYHGPGQLMMYVLLDIRRRKLGVRDLVSALENCIVLSLEPYGIDAYAKKDAPGVYINEQKVCSVGLRIRKGCSFHGLALNIDMDLSPFQRINPCGYAGLEMTDSKRLHGIQTIAEAKKQVVENFCKLLNLHPLIHKEGFNE